MPYEWRGKVVLITGAATGIGAGVVRIILAEGVKHVAVLDVAEQAGITLQDESNTKFGNNKVKFFKCDVTNEEQFLGIYKSVTAEQGYVDVVVNNAGIMNDSLSLYKLEINLNVTTLITSTLKAYELMRKDRGGKGGTVINISSIAGLSQTPMLPVYFATKSAVLQFSNCMGLPEYYKKSGVRVLTICFGATDTALLTMSKLGSFDEEIELEFPAMLKEFPWQSMESAAQGLVDAYKQGESGSTWLSSSNKPVRDITATVKRAYAIMTEEVFK